jgi:hypothetical protein
MCDCCGVFTQLPRLCAQCIAAGCDQRKKNEKCYTTNPMPITDLGAMITGTVMQGVRKVVGAAAERLGTEIKHAERAIRETNL